MGNITRRQHYIPQMILRNFCFDNNTCWEYSLNTKTFEQKKIESLFYQNFLYEIKKDDGSFYNPNGVNSAEQGFCQIEGKYAEFFRELFSELDHNDSVFIDKENRELICFWIALIIHRNPMIKKLLPENAEQFGYSIRDRLNIDYNFLGLMTKSVEYHVGDLIKGQMTFLRAHISEGFVISDFPIVFYNDVLHNYCYAPISSEYAVLIQEPENALKNLDKCQIIDLSLVDTVKKNKEIYECLKSAKISDIEFGNSIIAKKESILRHVVMPGYDIFLHKK